MQSGVYKLNEICDQFNEELWNRQASYQEEFDKLEKWRAIFTKIKGVSILLSVCEFVFIVYFMFVIKSENVTKTIDNIFGVIFIIWLITLLVIFASKKVVEKIFERENDIGTYLLLNEKRLKEEYIEKVYYPYVAMKFQGEYDKQNLKTELKESGLSIYYESEYYGGVSGICEGISFKENWISHAYTSSGIAGNMLLFKGTVIQFKNPKPCAEPVYVQNSNYCIIEKSVPNINVDNTKFNDSVLVNSMDKLSAFRVLTPRYMEQILPLIDSMKIPTVIYDREHILVFVKDKKIECLYEPQFPFNVEQCDSCASQLYREKRILIKKIYTDIVESMR